MTPKKRSLNKLFQGILIAVRTSAGLKVVLLFAAVLILSSIVVFIIEKTHNDGFANYFDSLWWTIVTVSTVGYGDKFPITTWGRIVAIVTIMLGMGITGTVTGRIASFLMERQMKEEQGLLDHSTMRGHFVVCGWKREMNQVLYDILDTNPTLTPLEIVLLNRAPQENVNTVRNDPHLKGIKSVNGDFIEERDLLRAGIRKASRVLILADSLTEGDLQQIDSKTVLAVMSVKNLNKRAYVCAEVLDTKFEKYLKLSHCDEILLSRDFMRRMLASASSGTGLSHVINALLAKTHETQLITCELPAGFVGKTYSELRDHFYLSGSVQLIGLLENTGNILDRKNEALRDAQKNPDISTLIPNLKTVKTLKANTPVINPPGTYIIVRYTRAIVIAAGQGQSQLQEEAA